jgi:hypothetical protein
MNTHLLPRWLARGALLGILTVAVVATVLSSAAPSPAADDPKPEVTRSKLGKNVYFEIEGKGTKDEKRRVVVDAVVVLREGQLEGLLTIKGTKEHEYILGAEVDAVNIHAGLMACGATPGSPVQFKDDKYIPAHGPVVKITLRYTNKDGKVVSASAQDWILDGKTKKNLAQDWVFGGSRIYRDPDNPKKPPTYLANYGDVVCLVNMETAMLDLPVRSPSRLEERFFEAVTAVVPPSGTKVEVIFEPVPEKKDKKDK